MNFFKAMSELKKGKKVRRKAWPHIKYLELNNKYAEKYDIWFAFTTASDDKLTCADMNATDWTYANDSALSKKEAKYLKNLVTPYMNRDRVLITVLRSTEHSYEDKLVIYSGPESYSSNSNQLAVIRIKPTEYTGLIVGKPYSLIDLNIK